MRGGGGEGSADRYLGNARIFYVEMATSEEGGPLQRRGGGRQMISNLNNEMGYSKSADLSQASGVAVKRGTVRVFNLT